MAGIWGRFADKDIFGIIRQICNTQIDTENQNIENLHEDVQFNDEDVENKKLKNVIGGRDIIQLKSNYIPKGLIPLEK